MLVVPTRYLPSKIASPSGEIIQPAPPVPTGSKSAQLAGTADHVIGCFLPSAGPGPGAPYRSVWSERNQLGEASERDMPDSGPWERIPIAGLSMTLLGEGGGGQKDRSTKSRPVMENPWKMSFNQSLYMMLNLTNEYNEYEHGWTLILNVSYGQIHICLFVFAFVASKPFRSSQTIAGLSGVGWGWG